MECHVHLMKQNAASHDEYQMSMQSSIILSSQTFLLSSALMCLYKFSMLAVRLSSVMFVYDCARALSWSFHHYLLHLLDSTFNFYIKTINDLYNTLSGSPRFQSHVHYTYVDFRILCTSASNHPDVLKGIMTDPTLCFTMTISRAQGVPRLRNFHIVNTPLYQQKRLEQQTSATSSKESTTSWEARRTV
jgi:hypothetical protein